MHIWCRTRLLCCLPSVCPSVCHTDESVKTSWSFDIAIFIARLPISLSVLLSSSPSAYALYAVVCLAGCPSVTQVDCTRQHMCYHCPSVLPPSSVTRMYVVSVKTVKVSIMQFSSPIHLSVYPTVCQSVYPFFCLHRPSAVCQCAVCCRPSVHLSVCPSVTWVNQSKHGWI